MEREKFSSRLAFILISAACAVGLGNVWRFPYVVGEYGGGAFILIYFAFLFLIGIPLIAMEYAVGRASQKSVLSSWEQLTPGNKKFNWFGIPAAIGSYLLMAFYTTICGWILYYFFKMAGGGFFDKTPDQVGAVFGELLASPGTMGIFMAIVTIGCFIIVGIGLVKGVEKVTNFMMISLFIMLIVLAVKAIMLPGGMEGLRFYIVPDWSTVAEKGIWSTIYAALAQAVFTLSIGIGSMQIFGSYADKKKRLMGDSVMVTALDTVSAYIAGLIIFPACFAFGVQPDSGPGLVFITLPNVFNQMANGVGVLWGTLFFVFLLFAGIATVIAVFENIIAVSIEWFKWSRKKAAIMNCIIIMVISIPCILGFNAWSGFNPLGIGNVLDVEDFILSNNLLPIGCLIYILYCCTKHGWGWDKFIAEVNSGEVGMRFPTWGWWKFYLQYLAPVMLVVIFFLGYAEKFGWFGM